MTYRVLIPTSFGVVVLLLSFAGLWGIRSTTLSVQSSLAKYHRLYGAQLTLARLEKLFLFVSHYRLRKQKIPVFLRRSVEENIAKLEKSFPQAAQDVHRQWKTLQQLKELSPETLFVLLRPFQKGYYQLSRAILQEHHILSDKVRWATLPVLFVFGSISLAVIVLGYLFSSTFLRPIHALEKAMAEVEQGNLKPSLKLRGQHELARLGQAFLNMARRLNQTMVSKAYMEKLLATLPDVVLVLDEEGNILEANPTAIRLFGYSEEEWKQLNVKHLFSQKLSLAPILGQRWMGRTKRGEEIPLWVSLSSFEDSQSCRWILAGQDIRPLVEMEWQLLQLSDQIQRQIGRDIHDSLGQNFTGIKFLVETLDTENLSDTEKETLQQIRSLAVEGIQQSRHLAHLLNPLSLQEESIQQVMEGLLERVQKIYHIQGNYSGEDLQVSTQTLLQLYRIAQEAIQNAYKHGRATEIHIHLEIEGERAILTIEDNGTGFSSPLTEREDSGVGGMGLITMEYRARSIGGSLMLGSGKLGGVCVQVEFPIKEGVES